MLNVDQALETIPSYIQTLEEEDCPLIRLPGRVAAADVYSDLNVPAWNYAAQDGFAVRSQDIAGASASHPQFLKVIDAVRVGTVSHCDVGPQTAVRIMTGAPIPQGADCVVRFEDTDEDQRRQLDLSSEEIGILVPEKSGGNIRPAGEKITRGSLIITRGSRLGPAEIGMAAALGQTGLKVIRQPVAAIIPTGDELVEPGQTLQGPQVYNSWAYTLAAQVRRCGGIPRLLGVARDRRTSIRSKIKRGISSDLIITCGGTAGGDYDLVKDILSGLGEMVFWRVRMAPGASFAFGVVHQSLNGLSRRVPLFALAGNAPANMVNFEVLVRPALLKMLGRPAPWIDSVEAVLEDSFENKKNSRCYVWVQLQKHQGSYSARISRTPEKGILPSVALADGLAVIPENKSKVEAGETVQVQLLDWY